MGTGSILYFISFFLFIRKPRNKESFLCSKMIIVTQLAESSSQVSFQEYYDRAGECYVKNKSFIL